MKTGLALAVAITMTLPAAGWAQTKIPLTTEQERRQDEITVLEGTLTSSVSLAAKKVATDVRSSTPTATLFTGAARAKGFLLEGYGVFFSVEIPALDLNVMLTVEHLERNNQRRNDPSQNLPQIQGNAQPVNSANEMIQNVVAADPGQMYRDAVRLALIDAMLDHSKNLVLGTDECLTIAARGSEEQLLPNEIFQLKTLILRVKGSDLADYLAGRITKEEARTKVEVRQF